MICMIKETNIKVLPHQEITDWFVVDKNESSNILDQLVQLDGVVKTVVITGPDRDIDVFNIVYDTRKINITTIENYVLKLGCTKKSKHTI